MRLLKTRSEVSACPSRVDRRGPPWRAEHLRSSPGRFPLCRGESRQTSQRGRDRGSVWCHPDEQEAVLEPADADGVARVGLPVLAVADELVLIPALRELYADSIRALRVGALHAQAGGLPTVERAGQVHGLRRFTIAAKAWASRVRAYLLSNSRLSSMVAPMLMRRLSPCKYRCSRLPGLACGGVEKRGMEAGQRGRATEGRGSQRRA